MQPVATQIFDRLERWARDYPDRPAHRVASPGSTDTASLSYRELYTRMGALSRHLRTVLPDDRSPVVVVGHKEPEMLVGFPRRGAQRTPIHPGGRQPAGSPHPRGRTHLRQPPDPDTRDGGLAHRIGPGHK